VDSVDKSSSFRKRRPCRTERARKKARRLTEELSQSNHLVQRLVEANQASTYAASLQADLNKDLVSLAFRHETPKFIPRVSAPSPVSSQRSQSPSPKLLTVQERQKSPTPPRKIVRYKKFWSDEGTPGSDVSLTGLPTEEVSFVGAAKRVPLETRITAEPQKQLADRINSPARIDSPAPYGFDPDHPYTPKELPPLVEDQPNLYRDPRRHKRRH
jgi:hypothetical protein